jgi:hypothetical protein
MTADGALDATQAQPIAEPEVPPLADDATTERSRAAPAATSPQPGTVESAARAGGRKAAWP